MGNKHDDTRCIAQYGTILVRKVLLIFLAFLKIYKWEGLFLTFLLTLSSRYWSVNHSCLQKESSTKTNPLQRHMLKRKIDGIKLWNKAYLYEKNISPAISVILKAKHKVLSTFAKTNKPWRQQELSLKKSFESLFLTGLIHHWTYLPYVLNKHIEV